MEEEREARPEGVNVRILGFDFLLSAFIITNYYFILFPLPIGVCGAKRGERDLIKRKVTCEIRERIKIKSH